VARVSGANILCRPWNTTFCGIDRALDHPCFCGGSSNGS
jgi:hypothetical protein